MPVIDWLELLWKAAEEETELAVPGELSLSSAAIRVTEQEKTTPSELYDEVPEGEIPAERSGLSLLHAEVWQESAMAETVWNNDRPVRSAMQTKRPTTKRSAAERLYQKTDRSALTALYHRVRETVSPGQPGVPGHGGTVVVREEVSAAPGLTEERLDRSLRRDSRRYDGGMNIY